MGVVDDDADQGRAGAATWVLDQVDVVTLGWGSDNRGRGRGRRVAVCAVLCEQAEEVGDLSVPGSISCQRLVRP